MILGSRFNASAKYTPEILAAAAPYLDIVSINYYKTWSPNPQAITLWEEVTQRPFIITEYYTKGADSGLPNQNGAGHTVPTQQERAYFYEDWAIGLMRSKHCVGLHWFRYIDDDGSNKGILNEHYQTYHDLAESMQRINHHKYGLRDFLLNQGNK